MTKSREKPACFSAFGFMFGNCTKETFAYAAAFIRPAEGFMLQTMSGMLFKDRFPTRSEKTGGYEIRPYRGILRIAGRFSSCILHFPALSVVPSFGKGEGLGAGNPFLRAKKRIPRPQGLIPSL